MKRSKVLLGVVGILLFSLVTAGSAMATSLGTSDWLWNGAGGNFTFAVSGVNNGESFSITSADRSATLGLIDSAHLSDYIGIASVGSGYTASAFSSSGLIGSISLGSIPAFRFNFSDVNHDIYGTYQVEQLNDYAYTLMNSQTGMSIFFTTTATPTPSATPIPGAAWLFGSSLLGLLGIGNRKSKA